MSRIRVLIQEFQYPPTAIKDDHLKMSANEALTAYEKVIMEMCQRLPRSWKEDAIQELRYAVLQCHYLADEKNKTKMKPEIVIMRMWDRLCAMDMLERNRGVTETDEVIDYLELEFNLKTHFYER